MPIPGRACGQDEQGLEQPVLMEGIPVYVRGRNWMNFKIPSNPNYLWFCNILLVWARSRKKVFNRPYKAKGSHKQGEWKHNPFLLVSSIKINAQPHYFFGLTSVLKHHKTEQRDAKLSPKFTADSGTYMGTMAMTMYLLRTTAWFQLQDLCYCAFVSKGH